MVEAEGDGDLWEGAEMSGWQSIETAPKDGRRFDAWRTAYRIPNVFWDATEECWCTEGKFMDSDPVPLAISPPPTHWMPQPPPPTSAEPQ